MATKGQNTGGNGKGSNITATVKTQDKAQSKPDKATKTAKADTSPLGTLRLLDAIAIASDKVSDVCTLSKRAIAAIFAALLMAGYKMTAANWAGFASLTMAYRHGVATDKATADGNANNLIYIRHATAGLQGNARHVWAIDAMQKADGKQIVALLQACKIDKAQAHKALQGSKVKSIAELAQKVA